MKRNHELIRKIISRRAQFVLPSGNSLSKAWGLIDRFSEDINIVINRKVFGQGPPHGAEDAASNSQRKLRLIELETKCAVFCSTF